MLFRRDMTDPKIKALNKAAIRTAQVAGPDVFQADALFYSIGDEWRRVWIARRFTHLIRAKNRRVRVQMRRAALSPRN